MLGRMIDIVDGHGVKLHRPVVIDMDEAVVLPFDVPIRAVPGFVGKSLDGDDIEVAANLPAGTETSSGQQSALKPIIQMIGNDGVTNRHAMVVSRADAQAWNISRKRGLLGRKPIN